MAARRGHGQSRMRRVAVEVVTLLRGGRRLLIPGGGRQSSLRARQRGAGAPEHAGGIPRAALPASTTCDARTTCGPFGPSATCAPPRAATPTTWSAATTSPTSRPAARRWSRASGTPATCDGVREWWLGEALAWGDGGAGAPTGDPARAPQQPAAPRDPARSGASATSASASRTARRTGAGSAARYGRARLRARPALTRAARTLRGDGPPDRPRARRPARQIAARRASVRIDHDRLAAYDAGADGAAIHDPGLDPVRHYLEGTPADVATYLAVARHDQLRLGLVPDAAQAGDPTSGRRSRATSRSRGTSPTASARTAPWSAEQLRAMRTEELADVLGQTADHELMASTARRCASSGASSATRTVARRRRRGRAARPSGWPDARWRRLAIYDDRGFYKRAQIVANDLALAGVAPFDDLDALTIFADNLVPHVLRCDGRPRLRRRARRAHRRRAAAAPRPRGARDPRLRDARLRAARRAARRRSASVRHVAVEPRPGAGAQGAAAAPLPHGLLLGVSGLVERC